MSVPHTKKTASFRNRLDQYIKQAAEPGGDDGAGYVNPTPGEIDVSERRDEVKSLADQMDRRGWINPEAKSYLKRILIAVNVGEKPNQDDLASFIKNVREGAPEGQAKAADKFLLQFRDTITSL